MARSAAAKGSYYKTRTKDWLERRGYAVAFMERMQWIRGPVDPETQQPRLIPVKKDQFGSDLLAMSVDEVIFVQVKLDKPDRRGGGPVAAGRREFARHPFPPSVKRWLVVWTPRARDPEIVDCSDLPYAPGPDQASDRPARQRAVRTTLF